MMKMDGSCCWPNKYSSEKKKEKEKESFT